MADRYDIQVAIHSDTLNESGFVENTIAATKGRDSAVLFATLARLARRVEMHRFIRPRDPARFGETAAFAAAWIARQGGGDACD